MDGRSEANSGLAQLCQIYWRPIFSFIYRRGYSAPDAQDLTQDFFVVMLEGSLLQSADPERGRFRSLLIKSLQNFLIDAQVKRRTQKRGGDLQFVSWEKWMAEAPSQLSMSAQALETAPAEALFDLSWAAAVAEEALRRLRVECESKGRRRVYEVLSSYLATERDYISYHDLAGTLGVPEPTVKSLLHQFRKRYRALLREEVAKTLSLIEGSFRAHDISLQIESKADPSTEGYPNEFCQVLLNILGNAVKFCRPGDSVKILTDTRPDEVLVSVRDSGPGIPQEDAEDIFLPYHRGHGNNNGGTGLGLYIAKGIIEEHGGRIWFETRPEGGTTFSFTLRRPAVH